MSNRGESENMERCVLAGWRRMEKDGEGWIRRAIFGRMVWTAGRLLLFVALTSRARHWMNHRHLRRNEVGTRLLLVSFLRCLPLQDLVGNSSSLVLFFSRFWDTAPERGRSYHYCRWIENFVSWNNPPPETRRDAACLENS